MLCLKRKYNRLKLFFLFFALLCFFTSCKDPLDNYEGANDNEFIEYASIGEDFDVEDHFNINEFNDLFDNSDDSNSSCVAITE